MTEFEMAELVNEFQMMLAVFGSAMLAIVTVFTVGSIFAGLQRFSGLNADRSRSIMFRSSGENSFDMKSIFSTPMPCSPVTLPPQRTHSSRI